LMVFKYPAFFSVVEIKAMLAHKAKAANLQ
jgi:hypothetical protein